MSDEREDSERRNVILVTIDSLRADHCGYWGYDRETTPALDRMAEEGFVFEQAIAPGPSTYESMPAVFTGNHMTSFRPDLRTNGASQDQANEDVIDVRSKNIRMNMDTLTIAEWFSDQGYTTGAFTTNPYTGSHTAFARGFDHYEDFMDEGEGALMQKAAHLPILSELKHIVTLARGDRASKPWTDYYERIVKWVQTAEEPYFLWIFLLDTHTPYLVDAEYRDETDVGSLAMLYHNWRLWMAKKWSSTQNHSKLDRETLVDLYDAAIRSVDDFLATLLEDVGETDPAVVVHADHGEAFGEHGVYGHDSQLYEENLHVPLVIHGSQLTGRMARPVSLADMPAILQHVATNADKLAGGIGRGPACAKTIDAEQFSLRGPDWKYVCHAAPDNGTVYEGLIYDLINDPDEQSPIKNQSDLQNSCRQKVQKRLSHERELNAVAEGVDTLQGDCL